MTSNTSLLLDPSRQIRIRRLVPSDAEAAADLARRAFESEGVAATLRRMLDIYFSTEAWQTSMDRQDGSLLPLTYYGLVKDRGESEGLLGLSGLYRRGWDGPGDCNYWLGWFAVEPSIQREGLGTLLLQATSSICAAKGGCRLCIETSTGLESALRLYRREGFVDVNVVPSYWSPGADLVVAWRSLDPSEAVRFGAIPLEHF